MFVPNVTTAASAKRLPEACIAAASLPMLAACSFLGTPLAFKGARYTGVAILRVPKFLKWAAPATEVQTPALPFEVPALPSVVRAPSTEVPDPDPDTPHPLRFLL